MKTVSNLYSITIRTGKGIDLGSNPVTELFTYVKAKCKFFIISLEKEENEAHFQGGLFFQIPKRQDHLRRDILPLVEQMYLHSIGNSPVTEKGLANLRKHSLKIIPHNDFDILVRYTLKEGITPNRTPCIYFLPKELKEYVPEQYCEHDEIRFYCSTCYKEESDELSIMHPTRTVVKPFWTAEYYAKFANFRI